MLVWCLHSSYLYGQCCIGRKEKSMKEYRSTCCSALVKLESSQLPDFLWDEEPPIITTWFSCLKCGDYCDIYVQSTEETKEAKC